MITRNRRLHWEASDPKEIMAEKQGPNLVVYKEDEDVSASESPGVQSTMWLDSRGEKEPCTQRRRDDGIILLMRLTKADVPSVN